MRFTEIILHNPDLIIIHFSAFRGKDYSEYEAEKKFKEKINILLEEMTGTNLKNKTMPNFLIYSRKVNFEKKYAETVANYFGVKSSKIKKAHDLKESIKDSDKIVLLEIKAANDYPDSSEMKYSSKTKMYCTPSKNMEQKLKCEDVKAFCDCNIMLKNRMTQTIRKLLWN